MAARNEENRHGEDNPIPAPPPSPDFDARAEKVKVEKPAKMPFWEGLLSYMDPTLREIEDVRRQFNTEIFIFPDEEIGDGNVFHQNNLNIWPRRLGLVVIPTPEILRTFVRERRYNICKIYLQINGRIAGVGSDPASLEQFFLPPDDQPNATLGDAVGIIFSESKPTKAEPESQQEASGPFKGKGSLVFISHYDIHRTVFVGYVLSCWEDNCPVCSAVGTLVAKGREVFRPRRNGNDNQSRASLTEAERKVFVDARKVANRLCEHQGYINVGGNVQERMEAYREWLSRGRDENNCPMDLLEQIEDDSD